MVARVERVLRSAARHAPPFWADVPAFTAFAEEVREAMQSGELAHVQRRRLLRRADHHGIRRFDANLIIAMVQHRAGDQGYLVDGPRGAGRRFAPLMVALTLQVLIAAALVVLLVA